MILVRCEAASSGPWKAYCEGRDFGGGSSIIKTGEGDDIEIPPMFGADADLIAAARTAIPKLIQGLRSEASNVISTAEIDALNALLANSTPGAWQLGDIYSYPPDTYPCLLIGSVQIPITGATLEDLIFMAVCRDDLARLLEVQSP